MPALRWARCKSSASGRNLLEKHCNWSERLITTQRLCMQPGCKRVTTLTNKGLKEWRLPVDDLVWKFYSSLAFIWGVFMCTSKATTGLIDGRWWTFTCTNIDIVSRHNGKLNTCVWVIHTPPLLLISCVGRPCSHITVCWPVSKTSTSLTMITLQCQAEL